MRLPLKAEDAVKSGCRTRSRYVSQADLPNLSLLPIAYEQICGKSLGWSGHGWFICIENQNPCGPDGVASKGLCFCQTCMAAVQGLPIGRAEPACAGKVLPARRTPEGTADRLVKGSWMKLTETISEGYARSTARCSRVTQAMRSWIEWLPRSLPRLTCLFFLISRMNTSCVKRSASFIDREGNGVR